MTLRTVEDGTRVLLTETVRAARKTGLTFAVIGGWSPLLLNSSPIQHPGTRDVDLLFERGTEPGALKELIEELRGQQYFLSAKHPFQLLRLLDIAGTTLAFNVDLLHPLEGKQVAGDLFEDHLEIDVRITERFGHLVQARSVATPLSRFIFDGHVEDVLVDAVSVPLMNELGLLVTKSESVKSSKRTRDALDIFFAVVQARNFAKLVVSAQRLRTSAAAAYLALADLAERVAADRSKFSDALTKSSIEYGIEHAVSAKMSEFRERFAHLIAQDSNLEPHARA
jgi:hypothetical protein